MVVMVERFAPPSRFWDAEDLAHELAVAQAGGEDFGGADYREGLRVLLLSMDHDPCFTERGRRLAWGLVVGALAARAHAIGSMKAHPGFDARPIRRPLVITGIPRTGTTALHKLLALDPQFQGMETWLNAAPQPRPPRETWAANPRFRETMQQLAARYATVPGARAAHEMAAEEVDECLFLLRQGFVSNFWNCGWSAPSYDAWWQNRSEAASYRHYARVLQLVGHAEPDRTWLLKNPGHVAHLELVFAVFPDALVVQTHRDPASAAPSLCSLLMKSHALMEEGDPQVRARLMLAREVEKWAKAASDAEAVKAAHPGRVLDVVHADFHARPIETVERIYAFAGLELALEIRSAMVARIALDPERRHGEHRYALSDFGMSAEAIRERFGDYVARYDLAGGRR